MQNFQQNYWEEKHHEETKSSSYSTSANEGISCGSKNLEEAKLIYNTLGNYDLFQFENNVKPDYANATFIEEFDEEENEWVSWFDEETGIDDINEYFEEVGNEE
ncbi:hypothetical protein [Bacillus safensis]|uniref:hypothetical protein n=1 Tax=Bacillus safensis TaxID=561879 RepID=UPI0021E53ADF|nr:hypothetical protein [Bacillus safensis]UXO88849.1 hypothetical protein N7921_03860 [Bacillus safensis]